MELKKLPYELNVCKVETLEGVDLGSPILFAGKTDEELSLVCETSATPERTVEREYVRCGFDSIAHVQMYHDNTRTADSELFEYTP